MSMLVLELPVSAQAPPHGSDDLTLSDQVLMDAVNARVKPLSFQVPAGMSQEVTILRLNQDAFIFNYAVASMPPFQVQAIVCEETLGGTKSTRTDATILGATETAGEFYDANLTFAYYPPDVTPPCAVGFMLFSERKGWVQHEDGQQRDARITISPERAVRHLANWVPYLATNRGDRERAAQFLAFALERESDALVKIASDSDAEAAVQRLALLEWIMPSTLFDLKLPLTAAQSAQVGRFLQLRLRLRQKLAAFVDDSAALNLRDQALLRRFGFAQ